MTDLLQLHKYFLSQHLKPGCTAVDFTMGNGHDTQYLSQAVYGGPDAPGKVYAFDIQPQALRETEKRLRETGCPENWQLILDSHANARRYIETPVTAGIFNLGWLPGSGDKSVTTKWESTGPAIESAVELLAPDGILLVAVYPGHPEGALEGEKIAELLAPLSRFRYCAARFRILNSPTSPYFYIVEKK